MVPAGISQIRTAFASSVHKRYVAMKDIAKRVSCERRHSSFCIRIDGILHLSFVHERLLGITSWINDRNGSFHIELTLRGGTIECDYDNFEIFKCVLNLLDEKTGNHKSTH